MTRHFHIGDVLSITTGKLVSPRHISGVYDILNYMTGDSLFTHQLPRAWRECQEPLMAQHPQLRDVDDSGVNETTWRGWLDKQVATFGEMLPVEPLRAGQHLHIDPIEEAEAMVGKDRVIVVKP